MTVGVGITSFDRPEFLEKCVRSILKNCGDVVDYIYVYDDGSDQKYRGAFSRAFKPLVGRDNARVIQNPENHGVAFAKNRLCEKLLKTCDWVILCEDDLQVTDAKAVTEYVRICEDRGLHHLSFAHHGPANAGGPVEVDGDVAYFPHSIGAWTIFSRECLTQAGLFDQHFICAWEHVEHELRLAQAGYAPTTAPHHFPDATDSAAWIKEQPHAIDKSSIRPREDWHANIVHGLRYWRKHKPETYAQMFGLGTPLHAYATSLIGEAP